MRVIVIGAGPSGLTVGAALARRRHEVLVVDRDPGPAPDGSWRRVGVAQFEHAHGFRAQVPELLEAEWPEAYAAWLELGGERIDVDLPGGATTTIMRSRRLTYERALRAAALEVPGLRVRTGFATDLVRRGGVVRGVVVDGVALPGDLVVDATGLGSRHARSGPADLNQECGISYVTRHYRLLDGAERGPLKGPVSWGATFDGYQAIVFPHEGRHFSAVFVRHTSDTALRGLRWDDAFDAAAALVPGLREWTAAERSRPVSGVHRGGRPRNAYRPQVGVPGLVAVGDAVATTTPTAGRGIAMASLQITALLALLDDGADLRTVGRPFGEWCDAHIRPWVAEHIERDAEATRQLMGLDLDLTRPLTTAAIVDAAAAEPRILPHVGGFLAMTALPSSLAPAEPLARAVYETGWRPERPDGPTRAQLAEAIWSRRPLRQVAAAT